VFALEMVAALASLGPAGAPGLSWSAPTECPAGEEIQARIEVLLGRPEVKTELVIDGVIERDSPDVWALELTLGGPGEATRHHLVAARCATLADAAALLVAVYVDPVAAARTLAWSRDPGGEADADTFEGPTPIEVPQRDELSPAEQSVPPRVELGGEVLEDRRTLAADLEDDAREAPASVPLRSAAPPRKSSGGPWSLGFGLVGGVEFGALPGPAGLVQAAIVADRRRLRLALTGSFMTPRKGALKAVTGASVRVLQGAAGLRACARLSQGRLSAPLCLGLEVGALAGTADGVEEARTERSFWLATLVAPSLGWSLHPRVALVVGAEIALPIVRPHFILAADDPKDDIVAHAVAPISGRILGGLLIKLQRR